MIVQVPLKSHEYIPTVRFIHFKEFEMVLLFLKRLKDRMRNDEEDVLSAPRYSQIEQNGYSRGSSHTDCVTSGSAAVTSTVSPTSMAASVGWGKSSLYLYSLSRCDKKQYRQYFKYYLMRFPAVGAG